jgi:hypothetical protein
MFRLLVLPGPVSHQVSTEILSSKKTFSNLRTSTLGRGDDDYKKYFGIFFDPASAKKHLLQERELIKRGKLIPRKGGLRKSR